MPEPRSVVPAETTSVAQVSIQAELLLVSSP
jgi:hypothetical protein